MIKIYLAGPTCFKPNAQAEYAALRKLVLEHGCQPLTPLDQPSPPGLSPSQQAWRWVTTSFW